MNYNDEEEDEEEEEVEDETYSCAICQEDYIKKDIAISFVEKTSGEDKDIDICKECLIQIIKNGAQIPQTVKVVEKIIEKPIEKIIYKTVDKNGNEIEGYRQETYRTKFD